MRPDVSLGARLRGRVESYRVAARGYRAEQARPPGYGDRRVPLRRPD